MKDETGNPRIVAVIQARMGSTRLPGKVLKPVAGKPLLWHIVHRLEKSRLIEKIAVATGDNPRDDAIVEFCRNNGIAVVRGPEANVLMRFARAAEQLNAGIIVRVCSDSPFIEGTYIDHLISAMTSQGGDYILSEDGVPNAHQGIDVFTRRALDKLMMDVPDDKVAREHVTGYFKLHPDFVPIARAKPFPDSERATPRLSIDTPDDLAFVEAVYSRLHAQAGEASLGDLLLLVEREPTLCQINAHVMQKPLSQMGAVALIRCDGGGDYGFGHVKRMIVLARALRDREGIGAVFAVNGSEDALLPIRQAGFEAKRLTSPHAPFEEVLAAPDLCILDCRDGPTRDELTRFVAPVPVTAVIDDASERRLAADFAYYAPLPQVIRLSWDGAHCQVRCGWQWALLGLPHAGEHSRGQNPRPSLLVSMGGSDPFGLTLRAAQALTSLDAAFRARFVIGPGMKDKSRIARKIVSLQSNFETIEGADDLMTEYASADLALASFGVTAYELAAFGVPAVYLCISPDHALSASAFAAAGMGVSLGLAETITNREMAGAVETLLGDKERRREMRAAGLMNIDGHAATRIAGELAGALATARAGGLKKKAL
jgi:spore coat polysaccharide biosynthesis protein SpsF